MDVSALIKDFLECLEIERNVSQLTIRNYEHYLSRFLGFLSGSSPIPSSVKSVLSETKSSSAGKKVTPADITTESIRQYRLFLSRYVDRHDISLKRVTQNYHLIALRSFLKFLIKRGVKAVAPEMVDLPKAESRSLKFLEREQVDRLLQMPEISTPDG